MSGTGIERPTGVTILSVLAFIVGIFGALGGLLVVATGTAAAAYGFGIEGGLAVVIGALVLIVGLLWLAVGWGLWNINKWGYQLAMILAIIGIILALPGIAGAGIVTIIINGIIIYYLIQPEIKDVFGITAFLS
ncbi:MAG: hypothetical protein ACE5I5_09485 [Candidatus Heimdallarchaeota archaeon]